jgi:hypothetical protein
MTATDFLTAAGFECLGPDATHADVTLWLRTGGGPDILVQLMREDTHPTDVARAIYAAGQRDKRDEIGGAWKTFTDAVRAPGVSDLWTNARKLQAARQAEIVAAASMPKT